MVVGRLRSCSGISSLSNTEEAEAQCLWLAYNEGMLGQCTVQHFDGSPLVQCPVWREEGNSCLMVSLDIHCNVGAWGSSRANHPTTLVNFKKKKKSIKKMPFSFPLYLAREFLRRSRGSQHQSTTLSIALNLTSLLHQGSPGTCRWHSGCCLYKADTQIK